MRTQEATRLSDAHALALWELARERGIPLMVEPIDETEIEWFHPRLRRMPSHAELRFIAELEASALERALDRLERLPPNVPVDHDALDIDVQQAQARVDLRKFGI